MDRYREKGWLPPVVHSETTTAAVIYVALSATFLLVFYKVNPVVTIVDTVILLLISFGIFVTYIRRDKTLEKWRIIKVEIEKSERHRHQWPENS